MNHQGKDRIEVLTLYLITEMWMQNSKLALIFMGLQAGELRGGVFLKVISATWEKTHFTHMWDCISGWEMSPFEGKLFSWRECCVCMCACVSLMCVCMCANFMCVHVCMGVSGRISILSCYFSVVVDNIYAHCGAWGGITFYLPL